MNVSEANATNVVLGYFLGLPTPAGQRYDRADAQEAAEQLARAAYKRLSAGLTPGDVGRAFEQEARSS